MIATLPMSGGIRIARADLENITQRFDVECFKKTDLGNFINHIPCSLCEKFGHVGLGCGRCPFAQFQIKSLYGCWVVLKDDFEISRRAHKQSRVCRGEIKVFATATGKFPPSVKRFLDRVRNWALEQLEQA